MGWPDDGMKGWRDDRMTGWQDYGITDNWMLKWPDDWRRLRRRLTVWYIAYLRLNSPLGHITIAGERVSNDWTMVTFVLRLWCLYFWRHSKLCHTVKLRPRQNTIGLKYRSVRTLRLSLDGDMFSLCLNEQNCQSLFIKLSLPIQNNVFMEDLQQNKF